MSILWLVGIGAVLAAWVVLSVLGNERQQRLQEMQASPRAATPPPAATPTETKKPPATSDLPQSRAA